MSWLREFVSGYVEAAQWSSTGRGACTCGTEAHRGAGYCVDPCLASQDDIELDTVELAPGVERSMGLRLLAWWRGFAPLLDRAAELRDGDLWRQWTGWELLGHDVWLSQVGHGTGAWDWRSLDVSALSMLAPALVGLTDAEVTVGEAVSAAAKLLGEGAYGYIGDDGLAHFDGFAAV